MSHLLKIGVLCNSPSQQLSGQYCRVAELTDYRFVMLYRRGKQGNPAWQPAYPERCDNELLPAAQFNVSGRLASMVDGDIRPVLERHHFDAMIIHGLYDSTAQWQAYRWCRRKRIPYFVRSDANIYGEVTPFRRVTRGWVVSSRVRYAAGLLCIGEQNKKYYQCYGAKPEQLFLAPWEIDYDQLEAVYEQATVRRDALRSELNCPSGRCVLVTVGRLVKVKGYDHLIPVLGKLKQKGYDVELLVAGDGPYRTEIERLIKHYDAPVRLLGNLDRENVINTMTASDMFVLASVYEPWGLVVNEAAMCGLPLVVSDAVGAGVDLVVPDENGDIYPAADQESLFGSLERLILDPALRQAMGAKSRVRLNWWRTTFPAIEGYRQAMSCAFSKKNN